MKKSRVLLFSLVLLSLLAFFSADIYTVQAKTRYFNTSCKTHKGKNVLLTNYHTIMYQRMES